MRWCGLMGFVICISSWFNRSLRGPYVDLIELCDLVLWLVFQLFNIGSIWHFHLHCSRIVISLVVDVWEVFWTLICVLGSSRSWYGSPQVNLSYYQSILWVFLRSNREMMIIPVIRVVVVVVVWFIFFLDVSRLFIMRIVGLHWSLCALFMIIFNLLVFFVLCDILNCSVLQMIEM